MAIGQPQSVHPSVQWGVTMSSEQFRTILSEQPWRSWFSETEWQELLLLSVQEQLDFSAHRSYWEHLLLNWEARNLEKMKDIYAQVCEVLEKYLVLMASFRGWAAEPVQQLRLAVAEAQIELQRKQLIFWNFEYEKKVRSSRVIEQNNQQVQAEFYNLQKLAEFIGQKTLQTEKEVIHHTLDGLMGILDASYTALFLADDHLSSKGTFFICHFGKMQVFPDFPLEHDGFWRHYLRAVARHEEPQWAETMAADHFGTRAQANLHTLFPATRAVLIQPLRLPDLFQGFILACSPEESAFDGFRQFFHVISTNVENTIQNTRLHARINEIAIRDAVTRLYNRHHIEERLRHSFAVSKRYNRELSVIMVDIDHFKACNDTYGHQAGDLILREVAQLMQNRLRATDVIGRYGGEEFLIVLQETGYSGAHFLAENIVHKVEQTPLDLGLEQPVHVTVSAGFATYPAEGVTTIEALIHLADMGLYQAKQTGRNRVCFTGQIQDMLQ